MDDQQHFGLVLLAKPTVEPVLVDAIKTYLCLGGDGKHDELIAELITASRERCERIARRALLSQTWKLTLDRFPRWEIEIPRPPLQSVGSIVYLDGSGVSQTLGADRYRVDKDSEPGRIEPAWGYAWPATRDVVGAVQITYVAGHKTQGEIPAEVRTRITAAVCHCFEKPDGNYEEAYLDSLFAPLWSGC